MSGGGELTPQQARWLLEAIECAYDEGWPRGTGTPALSGSDQGRLAVRLAEVAGVDLSDLWWLGTNLVGGWTIEQGGSTP